MGVIVTDLAFRKPIRTTPGDAQAANVGSIDWNEGEYSSDTMGNLFRHVSSTEQTIGAATGTKRNRNYELFDDSPSNRYNYADYAKLYIVNRSKVYDAQLPQVTIGVLTTDDDISPSTNRTVLYYALGLNDGGDYAEDISDTDQNYADNKVEGFPIVTDSDVTKNAEDIARYDAISGAHRVIYKSTVTAVKDLYITPKSVRLSISTGTWGGDGNTYVYVFGENNGVFIVGRRLIPSSGTSNQGILLAEDDFTTALYSKIYMIAVATDTFNNHYYELGASDLVQCPHAITVEYLRHSGTTWYTYVVLADEQKISLSFFDENIITAVDNGSILLSDADNGMESNWDITTKETINAVYDFSSTTLTIHENNSGDITNIKVGDRIRGTGSYSMTDFGYVSSIVIDDDDPSYVGSTIVVSGGDTTDDVSTNQNFYVKDGRISRGSIWIRREIDCNQTDPPVAIADMIQQMVFIAV